LVGAYTTQDIRAVKILLAMLKDNNAILRSIAVQLSCNYKDTILKKEIRSLLKEEKIWLVRLELIKAVGQMRIYEEKDFLQKVLVSQTSTFEEKTLAIQSLISLYETISKKEFNFLVKNPKAGVRQFACNLAFNLQIKEAKKIILSLLKDPHRDVRISSLNALGLFYIDLCSKKEVEVLIAPLLKDPDPVVAITAGWVALLIDSDNKNKITEWLECNQNEYRSLAAAAIAASGKKGVSIAKKAIKETKDPFVKVNLAIGLIGQREDIKKCCTELFSFIEKKDCMWMREKSKNPLFTVFSPSHIRHVDQIPNYPEAIDVLTQLELLSILAIFEGKKSAELIKKFLNNKIWQVTGVAAATLIKEGRDEALEIIRDLLKDENFQIRIQAAIILALYDKDENVISILEDAYANVDRDMKLYILEALGSIGMNKSFVFFLETLKEPFQVLRVIDAASLIRCLNH
jgi:HEAT repeat protein